MLLRVRLSVASLPGLDYVSQSGINYLLTYTKNRFYVLISITTYSKDLPGKTQNKFLPDIGLS